MAFFGRTFMAIGLIRYSARVACISITSSARRVPAALRRNWLSVSVSVCAGGALCAVPFSQKEPETLSHDALVRRASSLVTDSANTYLSQTTLALVDAFTRHAKAISTLLDLQQRYISSVDKLNPSDEDMVWQAILRQRQEVKYRQDECKRFDTNWMNAINLSELAAEAAYNAGADQASVMARTNLQVAQAHVEEVRQLSLEAEHKLANAGAEDMQRRARTESQEEEEQIPEAYLRED